MELEKKLKRAINSHNTIEIEMVFEEIYNQYFNLVCFIIAKYVTNTMDVEELANEVFVKFYKRILTTEILQIKYYLISSAKNSALNYLYQNKDIVEYNDDYTLLAKEESNVEYQNLIKEMQRFLNEEQINIILLYNIYGYSFKEIASKYQSNEKTIKTKYYRALKFFRKETKHEK